MIPLRVPVAFALILTAPAFAFAQLRFERPTIDLGELRGGPAYQHRFEFVNDSAVPIEITEVTLGCGCLRPVFARRVYRPGEKGSLEINLRTLGQRAGARTWQATVHYRADGKTGTAGLVVAAWLRNEVTVEPAILAMTVATALRQEVTITDTRPRALKIVRVIASSPAIRTGVQTLMPGTTRVTIDVSAADLRSERSEEILTIFTDDPLYRQFEIPITLLKAKSAPAILATPSEVDLLASGSQLVRLRSNQDQPVRIARAESDHRALKLRWAPGPGNDATLRILFDANQLATPRGSTIVRVTLEQPTGGTVSIPVVMRKE